jgi:hypothetical protein
VAAFLASHRDAVHRVVRLENGAYPKTVFAVLHGSQRCECRLFEPPAGTRGLVVYIPADLSSARADEWFAAYARRAFALTSVSTKGG